MFWIYRAIYYTNEDQRLPSSADFQVSHPIHPSSYLPMDPNLQTMNFGVLDNLFCSTSI